ncbi:MAG: hypothetical protein K0Q94_2534, partial [Paenibacillus sp.]|nr:hypothetical protein [Paenibacillus sp.]
FAKPYAITPYDSFARNAFLAAYTAAAKGEKDVNTALRDSLYELLRRCWYVNNVQK